LTPILAELGFWQQAALKLIDVVLTASLITAAAALAVSRAQRRWDARKAETTLRHELIKRASELQGTFYFTTQNFQRCQDAAADGAVAKNVSDKLDADYLAFATGSHVLEQELRAWFGAASEAVARAHQVSDLLTVRYFDLKGRNTPGLRAKNAQSPDKLHSGLTTGELRSVVKILQEYHVAATALGTALLQGALETGA
jgi:hypothetical protein